MNKFKEEDKETLELISNWKQAETELKNADYALLKAQENLTVTKAEAALARSDLRDSISKGYPIVMPYGEEGQGVLYEVDKRTGDIKTRIVTVIHNE